MSNFTPTENALGIQPIANTSTTQNHPLGTIIRGYDSTLGAAEFIYLKGVASTKVGSLVVYDPVGATTTLAPNTANLDQPCAIAMSANVASQFGWYQIAGAAVINKSAGNAISSGASVFLASAIGNVQGTQANGKQVLNARTVSSANSAASTVRLLVQRPFLQGQTS